MCSFVIEVRVRVRRSGAVAELVVDAGDNAATSSTDGSHVLILTARGQFASELGNIPCTGDTSR